MLLPAYSSFNGGRVQSAYELGGLASMIGLFVWFLFWFKNDPTADSLALGSASFDSLVWDSIGKMTFWLGLPGAVGISGYS
jgi:hypothetical protein